MDTTLSITNGNGHQARVIINTGEEKRKVFFCIGTSLMGDWAINDTPFVEPLISLEDFLLNGFHEEEFEKSQKLEVGESWQTDFPEQGVFIIRVQ